MAAIALAATLTYTRYSFGVDGPALARYTRDQMQAALLARGDIPAGSQLPISLQTAQLSRDGELWLGADGLPLRQILRRKT